MRLFVNSTVRLRRALCSPTLPGSVTGKTQLNQALGSAVTAARAAGQIMRKNLRGTKKVNEATQHDIKLELDVRCQKIIERSLRQRFPQIPVLGEEGITGDPQAEYRWVVDPIDGTVNFSYGIPHASVSIALQRRVGALSLTANVYDSLIGVVYDPFCDELWTGIRGGPARLNGKTIKASSRRDLAEAIVAIGFAKHAQTVDKMIPMLNQLIRRVRKIRIMGSAALATVYVATGRMDAYIERGLRLWDIAAGGLILECAGGDFFHEPVEGEYAYRIVLNNGHLRRQLEEIAG
jgi:myo-inositol-1(or 4)-monophosphatase